MFRRSFIVGLQQDRRPCGGFVDFHFGRAGRGLFGGGPGHGGYFVPAGIATVGVEEAMMGELINNSVGR